ncbi:MAG TPA: ABC transporter substrate-binding protein, partial [Chloroflexota bacterium]
MQRQGEGFMASVANDMRVGRRRAIVLGVVGTAASLLVACSGSPSASSSGTAGQSASAPTPTPAPAAAPTTAPAAGSSQTQSVIVGATAIIASAGLFVGLERGYFKQQGLEIDTKIVANSNDTLPLVATGKMDVANNAVTAFMVNAVNEGVNMKWVAGQASYTSKHGTLGLVVRKDLYDSGQVRGLKDLKGRKVAVPIVAGGGAIVLDKGLAQVGLSKNDVDLTELAVPNMPA